MGVYRQRSPYWWMRLSRPGQKPLCESTKIPIDAPTKWQRDQNRQAAEQVYAARLVQLARQRHELPTDKPAITFAAFAAWYEVNVIPQHRGDERERELLANLVGFFGRDQVAAITRDRATEYLAKRTQTDGVRASTANREMDLLKAMLAAAVPTYLDASPLAGMKRLRQTKIRKRIVEPDEEARLLAQLRPRDQAFYLCAVDTLLRLSDVIDLRRDDDHGSYLEVDTKTGPHVAPVSARLRAALDALPQDGPLEDDDEYYFYWRRRAQTDRDRRGAVRMMLQRACKRAGIPYGRAAGGITWHTGTRATGATRMLRAGVDAGTVKEVGHWASLEQMGDYLGTTAALSAAAVDLIDPTVAAAKQAEVVRTSVLQLLEQLPAEQRTAVEAALHQARQPEPHNAGITAEGRKGAEPRGRTRKAPKAQPRRARGKIVKIA